MDNISNNTPQDTSSSSSSSAANTNLLEPLTPEKQKEYDELFKFSEAKPFLSELQTGFKREVEQTTANRERRKVDINVEEERKAGRIKQSDTFVPMRVIDESIAREKPGFIAYLQQARRLCIFTDRQEPDTKYDKLEQAFTRGMTYNDWIVTHHKVVDGAQAHGWDWYEVLYDSSKPLHCGIEAVGHDRLEFSLDAEDVQNNTRIARVYKLTKAQVKKFVSDFGFDKDQAEKLLALTKQNDTDVGTTKDKCYEVRKGYCKHEGVVYNYWYALEGCDDWLLAPKKFYNGVDEKVTVLVEQLNLNFGQPSIDFDGIDPRQTIPVETTEWHPVDETTYPVVLCAYEETEQKEIASRKGRVFKDKFKQEVMTTGWTAFLNGMIRGTWILAAKDQVDGKPASELESIEIADGKVLPFNVKWNNLPYPDPSVINGLQAFDSKIASGQGQMTYAVQSKSSGARTTAKEVESSERDTALLSSVNITLFSATTRNVYSNAWRIVQSQALQDKISLYGELDMVVNPSTGEPDYEFINDKEVISRDFDIRPAGDVDVIQRQELIDSMMMFWPVVQNTPIAGDFLAELLKIKFAEKGESWAAKLLAGDAKTMLLQQCSDIISGLLQNPAEATQIGDIEKQNLMVLLQQIQQALMPPTQQPSQPMNTTTNASNNKQQGNTNTGTTSPMDATPGNQKVLSGTNSNPS